MTKPCPLPHNMPEHWREENRGVQIKTYCRKCGKFIGQRPAIQGKRK